MGCGKVVLIYLLRYQFISHSGLRQQSCSIGLVYTLIHIAKLALKKMP